MGVAQRQSKAITLEPKDRSPLSLGGLGSLKRRALSLLDIHWQPRLDCTEIPQSFYLSFLGHVSDHGSERQNVWPPGSWMDAVDNSQLCYTLASLDTLWLLTWACGTDLICLSREGARLSPTLDLESGSLCLCFWDLIPQPWH